MARYTLIPEKGYATVMNQMIVPGLRPFHESGTLEVIPSPMLGEASSSPTVLSKAALSLSRWSIISGRWV